MLVTRKNQDLFLIMTYFIKLLSFCGINSAHEFINLAPLHLQLNKYFVQLCSDTRKGVS